MDSSAKTKSFIVDGRPAGKTRQGASPKVKIQQEEVKDIRQYNRTKKTPTQKHEEVEDLRQWTMCRKSTKKRTIGGRTKEVAHGVRLDDLYLPRADLDQGQKASRSKSVKSMRLKLLFQIGTQRTYRKKPEFFIACITRLRPNQVCNNDR